MLGQQIAERVLGCSHCHLSGETRRVTPQPPWHNSTPPPHGEARGTKNRQNHSYQVPRHLSALSFRRAYTCLCAWNLPVSLCTVQHPTKKRRRQDVDSASEEDEEDLREQLPSSGESDTEDDDAYKAPASAKKATRGKGRPKGAVATTRKPRTVKAKAPARPKKGADDAAAIPKDATISDDNDLFSGCCPILLSSVHP